MSSDALDKDILPVIERGGVALQHRCEGIIANTEKHSGTGGFINWLLSIRPKSKSESYVIDEIVVSVYFDKRTRVLRADLSLGDGEILLESQAPEPSDPSGLSDSQQLWLENFVEEVLLEAERTVRQVWDASSAKKN